MDLWKNENSFEKALNEFRNLKCTRHERQILFHNQRFRKFKNRYNNVDQNKQERKKLGKLWGLYTSVQRPKEQRV